MTLEAMLDYRGDHLSSFVDTCYVYLKDYATGMGDTPGIN